MLLESYLAAFFKFKLKSFPKIRNIAKFLVERISTCGMQIFNKEFFALLFVLMYSQCSVRNKDNRPLREKSVESGRLETKGFVIQQESRWLTFCVHICQVKHVSLTYLSCLSRKSREK